MYLRIILITLISSFVAAKNNCVLYVLDGNQVQNLVDCDSGANDVLWQVVNIENANIQPRSNDSLFALLALTKSCAKVGIRFMSKGTLEADVYVSSPSCVINIGIAATVISNKSAISSRQINPLDKTSDSGWRKLTVDIEEDIENALITLQAFCNEGTVLKASFKHTPLRSSKQNCKIFSKQTRSNTKNTILTHKEKDIQELHHNDNTKFNAEDVDVVVSKVLRNDEESSFWTPLTISLIASSIAIVLIILAITAYQCGKSKGLDEVSNVFWNDTERTLTIPRARSIYSQSFSRSRNSGQFPQGGS